MSANQSWNTATRYFVLIISLGALLWLLIAADALIGPLAISALLAYILNPLVMWIDRNSRLNRQSVVLLVYLGFLVVLATAIALVAPVVPQQLASLADQLETITVQVQSVLATPLTILNIQIPLDVIVATWPGFTASFTRPDLIIDVVAATSANLVWVLVVIVTTYYLLLDWGRLRDWLFSIAPESSQNDMIRLYAEIKRTWFLYSRGQLRLMFFVGLLTGLASGAIGLPGAFAFGVLAGLLDIILSIGPIIVTIIAAIVAFVAGSSFLPISNFWFMILVVVVFNLITLAENVWLRPRILGGQLRLHPAVIFVAVIAALSMAGILTALIIVPLLRSAMVVGRYLYSKILDVDPWPEDNPVSNKETHEVSV